MKCSDYKSGQIADSLFQAVGLLFCACLILCASFFPVFLDENMAYVGYVCLGYFGWLFLRKRTAVLSRMDVVAVFFILSAFLNVLLAQDPGRALKMFLAVFLPAFPIYFIFRYMPADKCRALLLLLYACATGVSSWGIAEYLLGKENVYCGLLVKSTVAHSHYFSYPRLISTLRHPTVTGNYICACLPLAIVLFASVKKRAAKTAAWISVSINFVAMALTSKMSWVVAVILTGVFIHLVSGRNYKKTCLAVSALVCVIVLCCAPYMRWLSSQGYERQTWEKRKDGTAVAVKAFVRKPFAGLGLDNLRPVFMDFSSLKSVKETDRVPDNYYLALLAEGGLLVFIPAILFIFLLAGKISGTLTVFPRDRDRSMFTAVSLGAAGMLIYNLAYDALYWKSPMIIFWIFAGILASWNTPDGNTEKMSENVFCG